MSFQDSWRSRFTEDEVGYLLDAAHYLNRFLGHSEAEKSVDEWLSGKGRGVGSWYLCHYHTWRIALDVHFCISLNGDRGLFGGWLHENRALYCREDVWEYINDRQRNLHSDNPFEKYPFTSNR